LDTYYLHFYISMDKLTQIGETYLGTGVFKSKGSNESSHLPDF